MRGCFQFEKCCGRVANSIFGLDHHLLFLVFDRFLLPIVINTPAFMTVSKWLLQALIVTHFMGLLIYMLRNKWKIFQLGWSVVYFHVIVSMIHIVIVSVIIFGFVGFEDL